MRHFRMLAVLGSSFLLLGNGIIRAQQTPPPIPPPDQTLNPQQLEDLVAPIALYPDPLLTQIMVAATYPLEVVEAHQWQQHNPGLTGSALTEAAQQQNWDASVQALVVFPDVLKRLNDDVTWTTNLGNAFLAQQAEVMDAVQRLRQKAQQAGKLQSTAQQTVTTAPQADGPPAIEIQPADPNVVYVPVYNPAWFWGPALYYPYPGWYWPPAYGAGIYFGWGPGINMGFFFGGGWGGWGGWGDGKFILLPFLSIGAPGQTFIATTSIRAIWRSCTGLPCGRTIRHIAAAYPMRAPSWRTGIRAPCATICGLLPPSRRGRQTRHPTSASAIAACRRVIRVADYSAGWATDRPPESTAITVTRAWARAGPAVAAVEEGDRRQL